MNAAIVLAVGVLLVMEIVLLISEPTPLKFVATIGVAITFGGVLVMQREAR